MTIKDVNELRKNNYEGATKEQLMEAYPIVNSFKQQFSDMEKEIKSQLEGMFEVGDQMSLDFGTDTFKSKKDIVDEVVFDLPDEDMCVLLQKHASSYTSVDWDATAVKKAFIKGLLPTEVAEHCKVVKKEVFKISKSKMKEVK